ncbi:hypothetical protein PMZ80_005450 [Knufia obscura]|uniref:Uncharacterized protein n=2 Tax=Knufia TaxID=430999 RepID=A0AAN8ET11_9EURO|nr:hypothetical protein PMZ80_005450 [Knufia obscura]KAK5958122.1 hypothetical protein OHC33_001312 [Knufia fluminis]
MFPPTRLSIKIPDSPIEQHTFRSRSFRRFVVASCCLFLFYVTLHSVNLQSELQQRLTDSYRTFHSNQGAHWLSRSQWIELGQYTIETSGRKPGDRPVAVQEQTKQLPEVLRIPFEQAVADVELQGWEDEWFSSATFDYERYGPLSEPKIDFVYNWVNGSEQEFKDIKRKYELLSPLNDKDGNWISKHSINRYRDWDELRYSFRSLDKYAKSFVNKIQLLVNSVQNDSTSGAETYRAQRPDWLRDDDQTRRNVQLLRQEDFFAETKSQCLPLFDSVSIETQLYNTPSDVDQLVALSDDMFLGAPHSAADFFSPLFGPMMGFKQDHYNVKDISRADLPTFGEKPYLYYTSWLLNHRFGERDRKAQAHFTHSISRRVMKEAMASFPSPAIRGACERFRGESSVQIYPWYVTFHYAIERFREALLWSFIMTRGDANGDGYLDWQERLAIIEAFQSGKRALGGGDASAPARTAAGRERMFYKLPQMLKQAGLEPPVSNVNILWTSLDGPQTIENVKCHNFQIDKCFTESFDSAVSDASYPNPDFSAANIFSQLSRREPRCGDCLIKFLLSTTAKGLEPMLPPKSATRDREMVIKALVKYQHTVVEPEAMFVMVKDAEQAETELLERAIRRNKHVGQWCLNDDVMTDDEAAVSKVNSVIQTVFQTLFPAKGRWET